MTQHAAAGTGAIRARAGHGGRLEARQAGDWVAWGVPAGVIRINVKYRGYANTTSPVTGPRLQFFRLRWQS